MTPRSALSRGDLKGFLFEGKLDDLRNINEITLAPSSTFRSEGRLISSYIDFANPECQVKFFRLEVTNAAYQNFWTVRSHCTC